MGTYILDRELIESKFETLVSKSKDYIDTRNEGELTSLRNDLIHLKLRLESAIESNGHNVSNLIALKLMLSIIHKFTNSVKLMENLKSKSPLCKEFDTTKMLDILLPHLKALAECDKWLDKLDTERLEADYEFIESLEDQHKRVLLTYIIQDWHNIDEVYNLLRIGEIYKNIAEKLVNLSLIASYSDRSQ
jgi:hypothetical protein